MNRRPRGPRRRDSSCTACIRAPSVRHRHDRDRPRPEPTPGPRDPLRLQWIRLAARPTRAHGCPAAESRHPPRRCSRRRRWRTVTRTTTTNREVLRAAGSECPRRHHCWARHRQHHDVPDSPVPEHRRTRSSANGVRRCPRSSRRRRSPSPRSGRTVLARQASEKTTPRSPPRRPVGASDGAVSTRCTVSLGYPAGWSPEPT